jgi:RimJ/RimL family protein N-acetyltransferase
MSAEKKGEAFAFAVRLRSQDRIVGSTSYFGVSSEHRRVEIGSTWYTADSQGTLVNPECKYLLLRHAFDDWGAIRVQLTTDANNLRSQRAILKLGARFEGKLRNHAIRADGSYRDSMMYSITAEGWPEVKARLSDRLGEPPPSTN